MSWIPGIRVDDIDFYETFGVYPESRNIGNPNKKKITETIPYSNHTLDFSEIYGEPNFEERTLEYTLNVIGKQTTLEYTYMLQSKITNMLMMKKQFKLYDDVFPGYYFLVEAREGPGFELNVYAGKLQVTFNAYPFRISETPEGNNLWKPFNFHTDVMQKTNFTVERTTFKPLSVGQYATLGAWSTAYEGGQAIPKDPLGNTYRIKDVQATNWGVSSRSYYLEGLNKWVVEQDIVQAQNGVTDITLINPGVPSVVPQITSTYPVSIVFGNNVFNVWKGTALSEFFRLNPGENKMQITGNKRTEIEFKFYKELI